MRTRRRRDREEAVGTPAHGPDSAFKAWRVAAMRRRHADRWARCREWETDRWVPRVSDFQIKIYSQIKIAQNK
jgi:hypothetical protein